MTDLELLTDDELLTELLKRYDHAAFVGMKITSTDRGGQGDYQNHVTYCGNGVTVMGLCQIASNTVQRNLRRDARNSK